MKAKNNHISKSKKLNIIVVLMALVIALNIFVSSSDLQNTQAEEDMEIYTPTTPTIDLTEEVPVFTNGTECFVYAEQVLLNAKGVKSSVSGSLQTDMKIFGKCIVKQNFNNARYTDNNGIKYSTSISLKDGSAYAGKNNYQQVVYNTLGDKKIYKRTSTSSTYSNNWESYTEDEYTNLCGSVPGTLMYIVNSNTVSKEEYFTVDELNKTYSFKLILNPSTSTQNYRRLVKNSGDLSAYPNFKSITVTCVVDFDGKFKSIVNDEVYSCKYIIDGVVMYAHYDEQFECIGGDVSAPFVHNQF